jgi:membrane-associated protease RseP (regulator of RpoE activity)
MMRAMAATIDRWKNAAALLLLCAIMVLALFLILQPLHVDSPASSNARALLRLDTALGATVEPLDHATAAMLGLRSGSRDLVVTSVASNGPAASAGLRVGDVIVRIGGHPAGDIRETANLVPAEPLSIRRGGKETILNVQLAEGSGG